MFTSRHLSTAALAGVATLLAACSDATAPRQATRSVSLSVATTGGSVIGTGGAVTAGGIAIGGGDQLVITRAQLVVSEIELEGPALAASCSTSTDDSGASLSSANASSDDGVNHDATGDHGDASCGEMELGPVMVDLPMSAGVTQEVAVQVPEGTYHEIGFKLRAPDDDTQADLAFRTAHPELSDVSVRVEGTYNGQPFVWTSGVRAEKKLEFQPDLVVNAGGTNVTLAVNVASWFTDDAGQPVDPASAGAGTSARAGIEARIASSFGAFEDHDRNGHDDVGDDH